MARTKRNVSNARAARAIRKTPVATGRIEQLKARAIATVGSLLEQGAALQLKGRKIAIAKAKEARKAVVARAGIARIRTVDAVSHLEGVFEERVGKAISKLGVPTAKDVRALSRQVAQLQQSVDSLRRSRARA
jgi:poly(hydroxyalkanoate) granule-associated protein